MQTFSVFVSSPGDVMVERRRVENVVSRLNGEFAGVARLEAIRWETEFYQAYSTFQAQIPRSSDCDLVIGILRWRLGTELPPDFEEKLPGNKPFPSGTAYEILTAIERRQKGAKLPDIYVFRFAGSSPSAAIDDPKRETIEKDWLALKGFFQEWFLTDRGHFKAAFNPYTSEDDFEAQLERLLRKWVADKVAGGRVVRWPVEVKGSPFCGLAAFGAKHAPVFFGRSHDTTRAIDLWREAGSRGSPYLLVVGASGSGKSSLARAGLVPRLTTAGVIKEVDAWRVAVMRPGDSPAGPFAALAAALMQDEAGLPKEEEGRGPALPEIAEGDSKTPAELAALLRHADAAAVKPILNALSRVAAEEHDREHYSREVRCDLVLLIDQLEELFAASVSEDERSAFIDLVAAMVETGRVWVAATLRADFYARMLNQPALKKLKELGATYDLAPPGPVELAEIVRAPAEAAGLVYETDAASGERLNARLLRDADRPDMLPLIQLALSRLFEGRETAGGDIVLPMKIYESPTRQDGTFSRDDFTYDHVGDVYSCPAGKMLTTTGSRVNDGATLRYRASKYDCEACHLKPRCCPKEPARYVPRSIYEGARDMARQIANSWEGRTSRRLREKVEMLFAHLKRILRLDRLRLRGPNGARDEFLLAATAQNLRKLAKLIPMPSPRTA